MKTIDKSIKTAVALGSFDGLHRGHQAVINAAVETPYRAVVLLINNSFSLMPKSLVVPFVKNMGAEAYHTDFSRLKHLSGEEFVDKILVGELNAAFVSCGFDYRFGRGAASSVSDLAAMCAQRGIELNVQPKVESCGEKISSAAIRVLVENGEIVRANELLGHAFSYDFAVDYGDQRGRTLGYPTINQPFASGFTVPKNGVYVSKACVDGVWHSSVTNVGIRPTYRLQAPISETHIFDFSGSLYGKQIEVQLLDYIRGEVKFDSQNSLIKALEQDKKIAQAYFNNDVEQK